MGFEKFDKAVAVAVNKDAEVTVLPDGVISMTWKAYEMLETPESVEFYFDRERRVIGLAPAVDGSNGYMIRRPKSGAKGRVSVRGATVFKYYGIELSERHKTIPSMEDGLLTFTPQPSTENPKISAPNSASENDQEEDTNLA